MRAYSLCVATAISLLSGCQLIPFGNDTADNSPRGDRGRNVDLPWRAREDRDRRDGGQNNTRPRLDPSQIANLNTFLQTGTEAMQKNPPALADARIQFETALQLDPQNTHALHMLGRISDMDGQFEKAEYNYLRALGAGRNPDLLSDLGYSYMQQGRLDEARERLREALALNPQHQKAQVNLAAVHAWSGDSDGALAWLRQVTRGEQNPEQAAQAALQSILSQPPPGLGGEMQYAGGRKPPETLDEVLAQMKQEKQRIQRERVQKERAEVEWQRARMAEFLDESHGGGSVQPSNHELYNRSRPTQYIAPPGTQGTNPNGSAPPPPIDVPSPSDAVPHGQSGYYGPQMGVPQPGPLHNGQMPPGQGMPPQWPHARPSTQQPSGAMFNTQLPPGGNVHQQVPGRTGHHTGQQSPDAVPAAGRNPGAAGAWPNGRMQSTEPVDSGYYSPPANTGPVPMQNQAIQPIQQLGYWSDPGPQAPQSGAAARAARLGMSAGPGSPFPVNGEQQPGPGLQPPANGQPAPTGPTGEQRDVWRPDQSSAAAAQNPAPDQQTGPVPAYPPHMGPGSQAHYVQSPTWNHQSQQSHGQAGHWTQPTPLGQQWQANGPLASPTWQMQSPSMSGQFAQPQYYNPPNRAEIQHQQSLNLGGR